MIVTKFFSYYICIRKARCLASSWSVVVVIVVVIGILCAGPCHWPCDILRKGEKVSFSFGISRERFLFCCHFPPKFSPANHFPNAACARFFVVCFLYVTNWHDFALAAVIVNISVPIKSLGWVLYKKCNFGGGGVVAHYFNIATGGVNEPEKKNKKRFFEKNLWFPNEERVVIRVLRKVYCKLSVGVGAEQLA